MNRKNFKLNFFLVKLKHLTNNNNDYMVKKLIKINIKIDKSFVDSSSRLGRIY